MTQFDSNSNIGMSVEAGGGLQACPHCAFSLQGIVPPLTECPACGKRALLGAAPARLPAEVAADCASQVAGTTSTALDPLPADLRWTSAAGSTGSAAARAAAANEQGCDEQLLALELTELASVVDALIPHTAVPQRLKAKLCLSLSHLWRGAHAASAKLRYAMENAPSTREWVLRVENKAIRLEIAQLREEANGEPPRPRVCVCACVCVCGIVSGACVCLAGWLAVRARTRARVSAEPQS